MLPEQMQGGLAAASSCWLSLILIVSAATAHFVTASTI
jgi:hypothetical protein